MASRGCRVSPRFDIPVAVTMLDDMLQKSWRLGRLLGFPVDIHVSFLLLLAVVFVALGGLAGVLVVGVAFASVLLHELGHAVVGRRLGVHTASIELSFLGGAAKMHDLPRTPRHELLIAAAGPAVSIVLAVIGLSLGAALHAPLVWMVGTINLVIAGFNLIPALPMDGGRILRALLVPRLGFVRATDVAVTVSRIAAVGMAVGGLAFGMYQLLILAPFLWVMGTREKLAARIDPASPWAGFAARGGGFPAAPPAQRRWTIVRRDGRLVVELRD